MTTVRSSLRKALRGCVALVTITAHLGQVALAQQVIPNISAPVANRPTMELSGNGRSVVNIVTPNSGVSYNRYSTFNVGPDGVILNNSKVDTTARKGGTVKANANLKTSGPANTIVNEVNGNTPSSLKGDLEIIGTTADLIIANQNGIDCNGCSITGARNTTLTTGAVSINGDKVNVSVFDGVASVGRNGLSSDGNVTVSGRHVLVDGTTTAADKLNIYGGTHSIDPLTGNSVAQPIATSRVLPYAVDATSFGAMNGGTIRVIGNEAGLGVRVLGKATATKGIELRSNGDLFYKDAEAGGNFDAQAAGAVNQYGSVRAKGTANVSGRDVFIPGGRSLRGDAGATVSAIQSVTIGGEVVGQNVGIIAGTDANNTGLIIGDINVSVVATNNVVNTREKFTVYQGQAWADAWLKSYQDLFLQWTQGTNPTQVYWGNEYFKWTQTAIVDEYLLNGGSIVGGDVTVTAGQNVSNIAGKIAAVRSVTINAGLDFQNASKATTNRVVSADGCTVLGADCGQRTNFHAAEVLAGSNLVINAGRDLTNTASTIAAFGDVTLNAKGTIRNYALSTDYVAKSFETFTKTGTGSLYDSSSDAFYTYTTQLITDRAITTQQVDYAPAAIRSLTGSATLNAGADVFFLGSTLSAAKDVTIKAVGGVRLSTQAAIVPSSISESVTDTVLNSLWFEYGGYVTQNTIALRDALTSPTEIVGTNISISGRDIISTGARIFAAKDLSFKAADRLILDAGEDPLGKDNGELKATLADATGLKIPVRADTTNPTYLSYRAYLSSDSLAEGLVALNGATGGYLVGDAARKIGAKIDLAITTTSVTSTQLLTAQSVIRVGTVSIPYWYNYWAQVTTTTDHAKLTQTQGFETLAEALAGAQATRVLPSDAIIAATAYDYSVKQASVSLGQTTRTVVQAGQDLKIETGGDTILTGGTIANAGRNVFVNAGRDFVMLPLRGTGLSDGSSILALQDDFRAGMMWTEAPAAVVLSGAGSVGGLYGSAWSTGTVNSIIDPVTGKTLVSTLITSIAPTAIIAGGDMTIAAQRDVTNFGGTAISSGSMIVAAGRDVRNDAVRSYFTLTAADGCLDAACGMLGHSYKSGELLAGSGMVISAGQDILNTGSSIGGAGSVLMSATRDIQNNAISSQFIIDYLNKKKTTLGITTGSKKIITYQGVMQESNVVSEFGSITAHAERDLVNIGSVWSASGAIDLSAKNDIRLDAKTEELQNVYKNSGFHGIGYSSNKQYWNGFVNSYTDIEGGSVSIAAGHNLTAVGAKLISGSDTILSAGNDLTFDAQQNNYYVRSSGWSIGFSSPIFSIIDAAQKGGGQAALQQYVSQNPLLAAVHQLANGTKGGTLSNSLAVITAGARLLSAANMEGRNPNSSPIEALAAQFNPLSSNALDPFAIYKTSGESISPDKLAEAASNCVPDPSKCTFLVGVSLRFTMWKSSKDWTETTVSRILTAQDMTISAGHDLSLMGGTVASAGRDATLIAGNNLGLSAVADTTRTRSSSWGVTLGVQKDGWSIGADASRSAADATLFSNAQVTAGRDATFVAGQDISLIGANVSGKNVTLDAGRDLNLISQQNVSTSNAWSFNVSVSFKGATPTGGTIGGSFSNGDRRYTDTPTTIIADEVLNAYAGRNTMLAGAGMWSKTGKLKLDTNDLVFDNYKDKDTYVALSGSISVNDSNHPWDASISAQYKNVTGLTFATIGAGDLNIRARPNLDISGLNRDPANMQVVTNKTSWSFSIPSLNLAKVADDIKNAGNFINTLTAQVPQEIKNKGEQAVKLYQTAMLYGMSGAPLQDYLASDLFQKQLAARESYQELKRLTKDPEALAFGMFLVMEGERVYFDPADGKLKVPVDCAQNGPFATPCGKSVQELAQLVKNDPRGASAVVSDYLTNAVNEYVKLKGLAAQDKYDSIYACAASWALLSGNTKNLDDIVALAPASRAAYLADYTGKLKAIIATNNGAPLSLDQLYTTLPYFIESNNGRAEDKSGLLFEAALFGIPLAKLAITGLSNVGLRLTAAFGETVTIEAETAAGRAALEALVAQGRATVDASGRYLIQAGDPVASKILGNFGERRLADELGIPFEAAKQRYLTPLGWREVDAVLERVAYEAKAGVDATLTSSIKLQIEKDLALIARGYVDRVQWNFYQGADQKLLNYLTSKGISYKVGP